MTIAACYLSSEGVVLGADSTASTQISSGAGLSGYHYFNHNQKLSELGENGTVGVVTWGLGSLGAKSYRTMLASLADDLVKSPATDLKEVTERWCDLFWSEYNAILGPFIQQCKNLNTKQPYGPSAAPAGAPPRRTEQEERDFQTLKSTLVVGFCFAGYWLPDRMTTGFTLIFDPLAGKPSPAQLTPLSYGFWGAPNFMKRLILGADDTLKTRIRSSVHWKGTDADLDQIFEKEKLGHLGRGYLGGDMKPKRKRVKRNDIPATQVVPASEPPATWVAGMREHFQQTGYYRTEDLARLLGDPRDSVQVKAAPELVTCGYLLK